MGENVDPKIHTSTVLQNGTCVVVKKKKRCYEFFNAFFLTFFYIFDFSKEIDKKKRHTYRLVISQKGKHRNLLPVRGHSKMTSYSKFP